MICPICKQDHGPLIHQFQETIDEPILEALRLEKNNWLPIEGACTRCVDQAQLTQWEPVLEKETSKQAEMVSDYWILPIPRRLTAHPKYTGKDVTICFIDSGFYLHPDICQPQNRILKAMDIHHPEKEVRDEWQEAHANSWHGTMTSVAGTGSGTLSDGFYRSLAPDARLVLIKVTDAEGKIDEQGISKALNWVVENHLQYQIKIVNLSVTDDWPISYKESKIDQAIEELVRKGINVVAAAGNDQNTSLKPPANSPHAITVGGLDDANTLNPLTHSLYHSTYGKTVDQTYKPEIIAPAIWLPVPILPGTPEQEEAKALFSIRKAPANYKMALAANLLPKTKLESTLLQGSLEALDTAIDRRIEQAKFISPHYQHGDGTSFAAPIVCSVIAQMLEANPRLTPMDIRDILSTTSRRLPDFPIDRQGFGVLHPLSAVHHAEEDHREFPPYFSPVIDYKNKSITFYYYDAKAETVQVLGSFNDWRQNELVLDQAYEHFWQHQFRVFPPGKYTYKYLTDTAEWKSDVRNLFREPDGHGGFNSIILIEES